MDETKVDLPDEAASHNASVTAGVDTALEIGWGIDIVAVDEGGNVVACVKMDGAELLSMHTATTKAISAAAHRRPPTADRN